MSTTSWMVLFMRAGVSVIALAIIGMIAHTSSAQERVDIAQAISSAAPNYGVSPQLATNTARIESNFGQDNGRLGNIFQLNRDNWRDMGGGDMRDVNLQIDRGLKYLRRAQEVAGAALGHTPEPWETYMVHQQGNAGGPALMTAPPNAKAVDVLAPFYKNRETAKRALIDNLPASAFVALWKQRFEQLPQTELPAETSATSASEVQQPPCRRRPSLGGRCMIDSDNPPTVVELPPVVKHEF